MAKFRSLLALLAAILLVSRSAASDRLDCIGRAPQALVRFQINPTSANATIPKTLVSGLSERSSTHFAVSVNESVVLFVDGADDRLRVADISDEKTALIDAAHIRRQAGIEDEGVSSVAVDWAASKAYLTVDRTGTHKQGRIEACELDPDSKLGCAILLTTDHGMHSLVVDPTEGYMYWLNKAQHRVESAWMDGQFLEKYTFQEPDDPDITTAALTLDSTSRMLYYLRIWKTKCEIIGCTLHNRASCTVLATSSDISQLAAFKGRVFWTNHHNEVRFCTASNCRETTTAVRGLRNIEALTIIDPEAQPQRTTPNPCVVENGGCSHFCLLIPGEPWRSCACPRGVRLLDDGLNCDPAGVRKALLIAAKTGLYMASLDTNDFAMRSVLVDVGVTDVAYDPLSEQVFVLNSVNATVTSVDINNGSTSLVTRNLSHSTIYVALDAIGRNLFFLDPILGRLQVERIGAPPTRRTVLMMAGTRPCCLQVDSRTGYLYFGTFHGDHARVERTWLDGSHRQVLLSLPKVAQLSSLHIDPEEDRLYWVEKESSRVGHARLSTGGDASIIANSFEQRHGVTAMDGKLFLSSSDSRLITTVAMKDDVKLESPEGTTSNGAPYETYDTGIYHLLALKAVVLKPMLQHILASRPKSGVTASPKSRNRRGDNCYPRNGGCQHICVNLPFEQYKCLCSPNYELQADEISCHQPDAYLILAQSNVSNDFTRLSLNSGVRAYETLAVTGVDAFPTAMAFDPVRSELVFAVPLPEGGTALKRTNLDHGSTKTLFIDTALSQVRAIAIDVVTGVVFFVNGLMRRIEAVSYDGTLRRTIVWTSPDVDPYGLAVHPFKRIMYFVDANGNNVMTASMTGSQATVVHHFDDFMGSDPTATALALDVDKNVLYYSIVAKNVRSGVLNGAIAYQEQDLHRLIVTSENVLPRAMAFYNGKLYFANEATGSIDIVVDDDSRHLHLGVPLVKHFVIAHRDRRAYRNPCEQQPAMERGLCVFSESFNATWLCEDQFDFDPVSRTCLPPTRFLLVAGKDRIIRYRLRPRTAQPLEIDPFTVLPIAHVGTPVTIEFDSLSKRRMIYWIDAHDRDGGRIKRASDSASGKGTHFIELARESNCSQIFDIALDEVGRQLFVSCAPKDAGDIAFVHVWHVRDNDDLRYAGKVVAGDQKAGATNSFPAPKQIAVFGRLNALFYADCSRMLEDPVIVRCEIDGRKCTVVVSRGIDCASLQLVADLATPRLLYTTVDGIWSRDVYVDGDLRQLVQPSPQIQYFGLAPLGDHSTLVIASNETRQQDDFLRLRYDGAMQDLSALPPAQWARAAGSLIRRSTAVRAVVEPARAEFSCLHADCSHLCRVPYDTGSLDGHRRHKCHCPLDFTFFPSSTSKCLENLACESWQFRCANGKQCIHMAKRCDSVPDCEDRSDEHPDVCPLRRTALDVPRGSSVFSQMPAATGLWFCDTGKTTAIDLHLVCDGRAHCDDDSDEKHCRCRSPDLEFDCTAWHSYTDSGLPGTTGHDCVPRRLLCDGIAQCRNGADELPRLCAELRPGGAGNGDLLSIDQWFDFSVKPPGYVVLGLAMLAALVLAVLVCCCCWCFQRQRRRSVAKTTQNATLLSGQQTMITNTASPLTHVVHQYPTTHQVEVNLCTYPVSAGGSDYGYIPAMPGSAATIRYGQPINLQPMGYNSLPYRPQHHVTPQHPSSYHDPHRRHDLQSQPHLVMLQTRDGSSQATSSIVLPHPTMSGPSGGDFYAPPPSAASMSTYGVVKPAGMRQPQHVRRSGRRPTNRRDPGNRMPEIRAHGGPPTYSEIGSAVECSTPIPSRPPPRTKTRRHEIEREQKERLLRQRCPSSADSSLDADDSDSSSQNYSGAVPPANSAHGS
uniref:EGF-like domain-containing protein n=1 Tax=Panagrellus redivivus TaxID=6233 RepID=A0A7E4ZTJ0_PANRE